jgi:predicted hotdog family 3-hydroxylacyl-ACP dehydratase
MIHTYPDIVQLLPQRPPFVMVDALVSFDTVNTITRLTIRPDNIFVENGTLSTEGVTENIAQTCAARMGFMNYHRHDAVRIGVIGAIRSLLLYRNPIVGEEINTHIAVEEEVMNMTLVSAQVLAGTEILAEARMTIALTDQTV